mgnify:CR=1 FL=1
MISLEEFIPRFDEALNKAVSAFKPSVVRDAAEYSLFTGGKRLRPYAAYLGACFSLGEELSGGQLDDVIDYGVSVECLHTYSLIHDDLPCMDNDDLRRGQPTAHKKYGEWTALLAGDALLTFALSRGYGKGQDKAYSLLGQCAGEGGMILGQALDMQAPKSLSELLNMDILKTSRLFMASFVGGAYIVKGANIDCLSRYALNLGVAFQIADDLLEDKEEEQNVLKFSNRNEAQDMLSKFTKKAKEAVSKKALGECLENFADMLLCRKK